jgi:Ca-activated chloride channel family protein
MLNLIFKSHRASLKANTDEAQKVFAMLKLIPEAEVAKSRPPLAFALVIDTSGSMRELANEQVKLERAIEAAHALIDDNRLLPDDKVTVIHFDDDAKTLLPLTPLSSKPAAHQAVDSLRTYSGGTMLAKGMRCAQQELTNLPPQIAKRALLLTDGKTFDESDCRSLAIQFAEANTPIIAIGIGVEYNEKLMLELSQVSQGRPYHLQNMSQLHEILNDEIGSSVREVVTDLQATAAVVKGVKLDSLTRVYPSLSEVSLTKQPYRLGNIVAGDYTIFILEFTISGISRPPSRVRLSQVGLAGHAPGLGRRDEFPPQDLYVAFTTDESAIAAVDAEVLGYVQQKNLDRMMQEAVQLATVDVSRAQQTLQMAMGMTQRLGNSAMTQMLQNALEELNKTGAISAETRKTVTLGGRTKTVKTGSATPLEGIPSEAEIRKLTGA